MLSVLRLLSGVVATRVTAAAVTIGARVWLAPTNVIASRTTASRVTHQPQIAAACAIRHGRGLQWTAGQPPRTRMTRAARRGRCENASDAPLLVVSNGRSFVAGWRVRSRRPSSLPCSGCWPRGRSPRPWHRARAVVFGTLSRRHNAPATSVVNDAVDTRC